MPLVAIERLFQAAAIANKKLPSCLHHTSYDLDGNFGLWQAPRVIDIHRGADKETSGGMPLGVVAGAGFEPAAFRL